ncbi:MAG: hypothetical protein C0P72_009455 [Clostridia bacterium]
MDKISRKPSILGSAKYAGSSKGFSALCASMGAMNIMFHQLHDSENYFRMIWNIEGIWTKTKRPGGVPGLTPDYGLLPVC